MRMSAQGHTRKAAPAIGAAFALCLLLCFGILWPAPLSFAASGKPDAAASAAAEEAAPSEEPAEPKVPIDDVDNVVVEAPSTTPVPSEPKPDPNPVVPEAPEAPTAPEYENAWPIGADEAAAVVAELWADGTFVVDGAGGTLAFDSAEDVPWLAAGVGDDIRRVIFANKVEAKSLAYWFEGCSNLSEVANVPAGAEDLTRTFYECPKLVELPGEFELGDDAIAESCFGFEKPGDELLTTKYRGVNKNVLAYDWEADGRELVDPDAPEPPATEEPEAPETPAAPEASEGDDPLAAEPPLDESDADDDGESEPSVLEGRAEPGDSTEAPAAVEAAKPVETVETVEPVEPETPKAEDTQVNITIPSSVSMTLSADGDNTATIPVMAVNRSECNVAIVGTRLKRSSQDLPGGSWSLTTQGGSTTFVQDARFTPLGLEATFDRPVMLAAGDEGTVLVWHGTFTDYGMRQLVGAVLEAGDDKFAYGSMIWIVAAS